MSAYRDAYFKVLCRTVAEWVASRDDVVAFEIAKHGPGAFNEAERKENHQDVEIVKLRLDILGDTHYAAFVAGPGDQPDAVARHVVEEDMVEAVKFSLERAEISIASLIRRAKAKADAQG